MAQQQLVRDVMTSPVVGVPEQTSLTEAARQMRSADIGDVVIVDGDRVVGIITDRDIVIRGLADDRDPNTTTVGEIGSRDTVVIAPDQPAAEAVELMRQRALRRLPVCENGRLVGVVSLGNLAVMRDPESALADISAAPPDH
jgi:CBS domain-containing protein